MEFLKNNYEVYEDLKKGGQKKWQTAEIAKIK